MKLFGYSAPAPGQQAPPELCEVTLSASPAELREIAGFLLHAARGMEHMGASFDHMHLSGGMHLFENSPAFIVAAGGFA